MSQPVPDHIRSLVLAQLAGDLAALGLTPDAVTDDFDLRAGGVIDSLGFLELVTGLEDALGVELDFDALDPEQLTVIGPLCRHVAAQAHSAGAPTTNGAVPL